MGYLFDKYPVHLSLDVSTDNIKAVQFYHKCGLKVVDTYLSEDKVEFSKFETPQGFIHPFKKPILTIEETKLEELPEKHINSAIKKQESDDDTLVSESELSLESVSVSTDKIVNIP